MVIMAIDHTREYFCPTLVRPEDIAHTSVPLFLTRWVTHFCAPLFLFLSGVSACLYARTHTRGQTSVFLLTRGLWLVLFELAVFNLILQWGMPLVLLSILWAIGWSMIFLALFLWLPRWAQLVVAIGAICLHNLLPVFNPTEEPSLLIPALLHNPPFLFMLGDKPVLSAYTVFPWAAVMLFGYAMGSFLAGPKKFVSRRTALAGVIMLLVFMAIRATNAYGDPQEWGVSDRGGIYTVLSFFNVTKYPASFLFLLLTLSGGALLWWLCARRPNRVTAFLEVYGRVPFFYFVLHFALVSAGSWLWTRLLFGRAINLAFTSVAELPPGYNVSLARLYLVWLIVVLLLYYPCKWFGNYKRAHRSWWLSYI
ncbi:MAG: hypothetical protein JWP27_1655 [Flaviaesturariibacter sp.]|nr:hypothetical protein [Flaviaesturariibacter sp.]